MPYQQFTGVVQALSDGTDDVGYTPPVENAIDDGIVFPLTADQAILTNTFHGSQEAELVAIQDAITLSRIDDDRACVGVLLAATAPLRPCRAPADGLGVGVGVEV